jgi:hypothetical protein
MKPTIIESDCDAVVSIQVNETQIVSHNGTRRGPDEITLMIEENDSFHYASFTPLQAEKLENILRAAREQIAANAGIVGAR